MSSRDPERSNTDRPCPERAGGLEGTITVARDPNDPAKGNITIPWPPRVVWKWLPRGEA